MARQRVETMTETTAMALGLGGRRGQIRAGLAAGFGAAAVGA
jgi:hypothetical protein